MKTYTKEDFLKAAELGEVSMIDAEHIVSLLDDAKERNDKELLCNFFKFFRDKGESHIGLTIEDFVDLFLKLEHSKNVK